MKSSSFYNDDFYNWTITQAELLKNKKFNEIDLKNLIEEIEEMGKSTKNELINRLSILILHLLKWKYQKHLRSSSLECSIKEQRSRISDHILDNPSLKNIKSESLKKAYKYAFFSVQRETGLPESTFSNECIFTFEECLDDNFWPE